MVVKPGVVMLCDGKCRAKDCVRLLKDFCVYGSIFFCCIIFLCVYAAFIDLRNVTFLSHKVKGFCFIRFKERYISCTVLLHEIDGIFHLTSELCMNIFYCDIRILFNANCIVPVFIGFF